jgi:hypothetical protein
MNYYSTCCAKIKIIAAEFTISTGNCSAIETASGPFFLFLLQKLLLRTMRSVYATFYMSDKNIKIERKALFFNFKLLLPKCMHFD